MKRLLRSFAIYTIALYVASQVAQGITFAEGPKTIVLAGIALTLSSFLAKPVINILLLPINLVTFGLFSWLSSAVVLFLVTLLVGGFSISGFNYPGYSSVWIDLPALAFGGILAFVAFGLVISLITTLVHWLIK